ncbi:uncharacterized protein LY89DRAFT_209157 [Mollisia scopiformis]|uniref:Uncharacterized protein n=1 Tax=Mollisia scopiformis TaxID=149040 RepID=A0A194WX53_MOLSC|nr:uncharacterized protein LY89DRAFT_209157 [Mollisia scopiformis]KUJ12505.1 hypothetical protein LY89DRAFT_209157 [Mollisia scopiformis]
MLSLTRPRLAQQGLLKLLQVQVRLSRSRPQSQVLSALQVSPLHSRRHAFSTSVKRSLNLKPTSSLGQNEQRRFQDSRRLLNNALQDNSRLFVVGGIISVAGRATVVCWTLGAFDEERWADRMSNLGQYFPWTKESSTQPTERGCRKAGKEEKKSVELPGLNRRSDGAPTPHIPDLKSGTDARK